MVQEAEPCLLRKMMIFSEKKGIWKINKSLIEKANADIENDSVKNTGTAGDFQGNLAPIIIIPTRSYVVASA